MQNNSPIEAGRSSAPSANAKMALVDAINQVFTLFRLNYHNQYLKAFGNTDELNEVKRLWMEMLQRFEPATLLRAAKSVIENSEYLPTLHAMIHACERHSQQSQWPDAHSAYIEACRAPSPKSTHPWSHPLVYHAGKRSDWYFLQSSAEAVAYPIFKRHYEALIEDVRNGKQLSLPEPHALPPKSEAPMDKATSQQKIQGLRQALEL